MEGLSWLGTVLELCVITPWGISIPLCCTSSHSWKVVEPGFRFSSLAPIWIQSHFMTQRLQPVTHVPESFLCVPSYPTFISPRVPGPNLLCLFLWLTIIFSRAGLSVISASQDFDCLENNQIWGPISQNILRHMRKGQPIQVHVLNALPGSEPYILGPSTWTSDIRICEDSLQEKLCSQSQNCSTCCQLQAPPVNRWGAWDKYHISECCQGVHTIWRGSVVGAERRAVLGVAQIFPLNNGLEALK